MRVGLLTREFPPEVYGGAGVHVEYLSRELAALEGVDVEVHAFGGERPSPLVAGTYRPWDRLASVVEPHRAALESLTVDVAMAAAVDGVDIVHSHTWYANLAGHLAAMVHGIPHVMTAHSLEPLRPWKAEQLGGGYALSSWCERTSAESAAAIVAVSSAMRDDVVREYPGVDPARVHVIHNGIDVDEYAPVGGDEVRRRLGLPVDRPYALFVGRMTRQKGIIHLLDAVRLLDPGHVLVVVAAAPDTNEIGVELRAAAAEAAAAGGGELHFLEMAPERSDVIELLAGATVFVCPSIYEPFGLVNVEAMACGTAVVASAVGGIPEIVVPGETGSLVDLGPTDDTGTPLDREGFAATLAREIGALLDDPRRADTLGAAGRARVVESFSWRAIAARTAVLYGSLLDG